MTGLPLSAMLLGVGVSLRLLHFTDGDEFCKVVSAVMAEWCGWRCHGAAVAVDGYVAVIDGDIH